MASKYITFTYRGTFKTTGHGRDSLSIESLPWPNINSK